MKTIMIEEPGIPMADDEAPLPIALRAPTRCARCGTRPYEHDIFCARCGHRARTNCPGCGIENEHPAMYFCTMCGGARKGL